ncbi:MAG TPA: DinB family protein [Dehalococcoidia bacterium]|jgi:hypothetical protein|nr:DinB family protein [Dehalococcoidia bacterium]
MTIANDTVRRVREYLVTDAARLSIPEIIEQVRAGEPALRAACAAMPAARFAERPGPDDWSAAEILAHLLEWNERHALQIVGLLERGTAPADDAVATPALQSADEFWAGLDACRSRLFARVLAARGDEHLNATHDHMWFGPLNWREWLLFLRIHDRDHLRGLQQIGERLAG